MYPSRQSGRVILIPGVQGNAMIKNICLERSKVSAVILKVCNINPLFIFQRRGLIIIHEVDSTERTNRLFIKWGLLKQGCN